MKFTDIFIKRPVLATVISLLIFLFGVRAFFALTVREYPQTSNAQVTVTTAYPGASAELVKGFITTPLESAIAEANGIDYLESTSVQGVSQIVAHLVLNYDANKALTEITTKVNQVRNQLPAEAQIPTIDIQTGKSTDDMYIGFYSDVLKPNQITDYLMRVVQPKLATIEGVQKAEVLGAHKFAMRIWLKPDKMAALGVTPSDVRSVLADNNYLAGVGETKGSMISVSFTSATDLHSEKQFDNLIVKHTNNSIVRLGDIATVDLGSESYATDVRFNGKSATFIGIQAAPDANSLDVIKRVRAALPSIRSQLPSGLSVDIPYDATKYINDSINEVVKTLGEALAIVVLVIYLFLGSIRSVVIPVIAMPLSLIGAGMIMLALGFSINLLTLLSMVLAIGLVVDDAIIVVENIHRHIHEENASPLDAALRGARELGGPVIAMTITLVAVYAPIGFIGGLTGSLFTEFAFTLAGAVLVSGVIALTLSPMMCSKLLRRDEKKGFSHFLDGLFDRLKRRYERTLHNALNYRPVIFVFAIVVLVSCFFLFQSTKKELAPTEDQGFILALASGAADANLDQTMLYTKQITQVFKSFPQSDSQFLLNGAGGGGAAATGNSAISGMVMKPWGQRKETAMQLLPAVQQKLNKIAGLQIAAFQPPVLPGASGLPVQFVIGTTQSPLQLNEVTQELLRKAYASGLFIFANTDLKYDKPSVRIDVDRAKAAELGLSMKDIGGDLASMLGGNYVNYFSISGRSYQVIPQVQRVSRLNPSQLDNYYIRAANGEMFPLSTVVSLHPEVVPEQLKRFQQLNSATISAVPMPGVSLGEALNFLQTQANQILPPGYSTDYAGQSRQYEQAGSALIFTFFFAIIIIFLVLSAQFESFRDPLIMLVSVPMSISGALIFLTLGLASVNIYTEVGLITLIGLISKHGILIVQFANQLQIERGLGKREAVEEAAAIRLRPILMTTSAMVLGVLPLILATGAGAVSRFDMGLVIASGMSIGTLFTLYVVPAMYTLLAREHSKSASGEEPVA